jgi:hypothetical protein
MMEVEEKKKVLILNQSNQMTLKDLLFKSDIWTIPFLLSSTNNGHNKKIAKTEGLIFIDLYLFSLQRILFTEL